MAEAIPTNDIKFVAAILYRVYSRTSQLATRTSQLATRTSQLASMARNKAAAT